jgi:hypothetical protein
MNNRNNNTIILKYNQIVNNLDIKLIYMIISNIVIKKMSNINHLTIIERIIWKLLII